MYIPPPYPDMAEQEMNSRDVNVIDEAYDEESSVREIAPPFPVFVVQDSNVTPERVIVMDEGR